MRQSHIKAIEDGTSAELWRTGVLRDVPLVYRHRDGRAIPARLSVYVDEADGLAIGVAHLGSVEAAAATLVAAADRANAGHADLIATTRVLLEQHAAAVQLAESARAETRRAWGVAIVAGVLLAIALLR